ncbi:MAG: hypothetical protein ACP6IY_01565 [Promethearchaeia archaeon]
MKIKIEKFWDKKTKTLVEDINSSLKKMEIEPVRQGLFELFKIIENRKKDAKIRVSLCFVLEKLAQYEPFHDEIINFFMDLLEDEKDPLVIEFSVYILGNIVLENPNLTLITRTLPIFVKFCEDSSDYVRKCAEDIKNRLNRVKETKIKEQELIDTYRSELNKFINSRLEDMNRRAQEISKEALSLDYEAAFKKQEIMIKKIHEFSELNDKAEREIKNYISKLVRKNPIFNGEFKEELKIWKNKRAEKEDLIRQIHCIIRIQSKIFNIIQYIKNKGANEEISIEELREQTKGGIRGKWRDDEIIKTLEKLVEEEIIPTFFLEQIKNLRDIKDKK